MDNAQAFGSESRLVEKKQFCIVDTKKRLLNNICQQPLLFHLFATVLGINLSYNFCHDIVTSSNKYRILGSGQLTRPRKCPLDTRLHLAT